MILRKEPVARASRRGFFQTVGAGVASSVLLPAFPPSSAEAAPYPVLAELQAAHRKKGMIPPNKTYRMMEWESHTPPEEHFNINLDAATQAARDAGAESMMFYSQSL